MEFTSVLEKFDSDLWGFHFEVPDDIAEHYIKSTGRRVVATLMGAESYHCAIMQWSGGRHFINVNKKLRDSLGLVLGQGVHVSLEVDQSKYGLPMSEEFEEAIRQDEDASVVFHELTPGKQRTLIYYADNVKSSQIKLRRALVVLEHLKLTRGKVDFKQLNEEMKAANRRERLW
jgi:hypothetical protein